MLTYSYLHILPIGYHNLGMSDLIRTDNIFGKRANIVGNISADLVLESLGKIYIKSRNSAKTLEEVIKSVALGDINTVGSRTKVVEGLENLDIESVKEGELIYDKLSNILYIWVDGESIELINVAPDGTGYVKRSGDTMTGRLTINVESGPPLHVNSTDLVQNLNANYLQGESAAAFTRRTRNENITGKWAFRNTTHFHDNASFSKDAIINGSIGTPYFASGFGGSGWRLDAETNTLTIDNLIVRKLMQVYELVVNKISATNGSLWVTNAGKVKYVQKLPVYTADLFVKDTRITSASLEAFVKSLQDKTYFVILPEASNENTFMLKGADIMSASGVMPAGKGRTDEIERRYTADALSQGYVVMINNLEAVTTFMQDTTDEDVFYYKLNTLFNEVPDSGYITYKLYDQEFKHNVELPIVTKDFYEAFKVSEEYRVIYENMTVEMNSTDTKHIENELVGSGEFTKAQIKQALVTKAMGLAGIWPGSNTEFLNPASTDPQFITYVKSYYKYYQIGNYYLVTFDDDQLPVFKPGDLLRCQKWTYGGIKYYDAIVCNYIDSSSYIIQVADQNFDISTIVTYDDSLEPTIIEEKPVYNQALSTTTNRIDTSAIETAQTEEEVANVLVGLVEKNDALVQMGNLWDVQRQNAVYITSVDDGAPYMDVLSGINRPDFSVNYYTPIYNTIKLYKKNKYENIGLTNLDIPYTGDYYIQDGTKTDSKAEFVLGDYTYNDTKYRVLVDLSLVSNISNPIYLSTLPNDNTLFTGEYIYGELLSEDDCIFVSEDGESTLIREKTYNNLRINSSKTTKVRVGNLDGIRDDMFPINKQPYGYGLYGSNVFLIGEFYLNNGRSLAEISQDAINFAIASESAMNSSIDFLRKDVNLAKQGLERSIQQLGTQMSNDYYSKNDLDTAGFNITNVDILNNDGTITRQPGIVIWANYLKIATSKRELEGLDEPTAMFHHGIIDANLIRLYSIHSKATVGDPVYYLGTEVVTKDESTGKYYKEDNTELTTEEAARVVEVYKYFKWAINEDGDGYLASNNFNWDKEGNIEIQGMITLGGEANNQDVRKNILRVLNSSGEEVVNVGNYNFSSIRQWLSENPAQFWNYNVAFDTSYITIIDKQNLSISNQLCELTLKVSKIQHSSCKYAQFYLQLFNGDIAFTSETATLQEGGTVTLSRNLKNDGEFAGQTITRILIQVKKYIPTVARARGVTDEDEMDEMDDWDESSILNPYEIIIDEEEDTDEGYEGGGGGGGSTALQSTIAGYFQAKIATTQKTQIGANFLGVSPDPNTLLWAGSDGIYGIQGDSSDPGTVKFSGIRISSEDIYFAINQEIAGVSDMRSLMSSYGMPGTVTLSQLTDRTGDTVGTNINDITSNDYSIHKLYYDTYTLRNDCIRIDGTQNKTYIMWVRTADTLKAGYTINLSTLIMDNHQGNYYLCCTNNVKTITYNSNLVEVPSWWETNMGNETSSTPTDECTIRTDYADIQEFQGIYSFGYKTTWVKYVPLYVSSTAYSTTPQGIKLMYLGFNKWKLFR